jgi:hypothetical protein
LGRRRKKLSKAEAKEFLATEKGQDWLEQKIKEKRAKRPWRPVPWRLRRTKLPFFATINEGTIIIVDRVDGEIVTTKYVPPDA